MCEYVEYICLRRTENEYRFKNSAVQGSPEQLLPRAVKLAAANELEPHSGACESPLKGLP